MNNAPVPQSATHACLAHILQATQRLQGVAPYKASGWRHFMKRDSAIRTLRKLLCVQILVILWNRIVKCTYEPI